MNIRFIPLLVFTALSLQAVDFVRFAPEGSSPTQELKSTVAAGKPFVLEICYGEITEPLPTAPSTDFINPGNAPAITRVLTDEFLAKATRLQIAVSSTDHGRITRPGQSDIVYHLTPNKDGYSLDILADLQLSEADTGLKSRRQIHTRITLTTTTNWMVMGGLTRPTEDGKTSNLIYGIRLLNTPES